MVCSHTCPEIGISTSKCAKSRCSGAIGRQEEQLAASLFDQLPHPLWSVCPEVVHHHYLTKSQSRPQKVLYIDFEDLAGGRPFHGHGRSHTLRVKACYQRSAPPAVPRDLKQGALTDGCIGVDGSKGSVWVPIPSTNTKRRRSSSSIRARQISLKNSSLSAAALDLFFGCERG